MSASIAPPGATAGRIAGIDASQTMLSVARARNRVAIAEGRVALRTGSVEKMPFADGSFDEAFAINSLQLWPDAAAGLREILRVLKPGGRIALAFTSHSGQPNRGVAERLTAGFVKAAIVERDGAFLRNGGKAAPLRRCVARAELVNGARLSGY